MRDRLQPSNGRRELAGRVGGDDAGLLGHLVEQFGTGVEALERDPEQLAVDLPAGDRVGEDVGDLDRGDLVGGAREPGRAAVVVGDRAGDVVGGLGQADQQRARGGVVEPEVPALERGARGAVGRLAGDVLQRLDAERRRHQQLADVVQQAGEVSRVDVGADQVGGGGRVGGDRHRVHVQLAAGEARAAREALEEAVGLGLQRDPHERAAAEQRHRLADRARPDRPGVGRAVGVAQQVGRERLVGFDDLDEVGRGAVGVVGQHPDARHRATEHRQRADAAEGVVDAGVGLVEAGHFSTSSAADPASMSAAQGPFSGALVSISRACATRGWPSTSQATSTWSLRP